MFVHTNHQLLSEYVWYKPDSNQPTYIFKPENLNEITVANLRFRPIIDQTGLFVGN